MAQSVGEIGLDLVINQNQYDRQLKGITSMAKKAGAALAAAFTVKKLVDFGKECIELGSDLAEVQNVVDVTFPSMTAQVDKFAQSAAGAFGLSETMAKNFTGTFGAMAKAFGFSESAAYEMSTTLTGLAGDVASFYNIDQNEAYTKLKSVFSGETETLKDLGVVMTQTALDAYALANGYGKTVSAMSEAEKVALRYAFVQDQLSAASGDFSRTSGSWANQVRILSLRFDSLKATIGQGLINAFLPVIKVINTVIGKLQVLANAFKELTELFTGEESVGDTAAQSLAGTAEAADDVASAAVTAAKKMKALMGFDKINKLDDTSSDSENSGDSSTAIDFGNIEAASSSIEKAESSVSKLTERVKELAKLFKEGYSIGFKTKSLGTLKENVNEIRENIKEIWDNEELSKARKDFENQFAETTGTVAGSAASIGVSVGTGVTGGIRQAVEDEDFKKSVTTNLTGAFGNLTGALEDAAKLSEAFAKIGEAFESESFQDIIAFFTKLSGYVSGNLLDCITGFAADIWHIFTKPIADNAEKLKTILSDIFDIISGILKPLQAVLDTLMGNDKKYSDSSVHAFFTGIAEDMTKKFSASLDVIHSTLEKLKTGIEMVQTAYGKVLSYTLPIPEKIKSAFKDIGTWFGNVFKEAYSKVTSAFSGTKSYFTGVWNNIKNSFSSVATWFKNTFTTAWSNIKNIFSVSTVKSVFTSVLNAVKSPFSSVATWFKNTFTTAWTNVKNVFASGGKIFDGIKSGIESTFRTIVNKLISGINTIIKTPFNAINGLLNKVREVSVLGAKPFSKLWSKNPLTVPTIPKLWNGGYVKANTPQLAMIGDNRHQGEVVAPEDKLKEMALEAARMAGGSNGYSLEILKVLLQILEVLKALDLNIVIDGKKLKDIIVEKINQNTRATGVCEILT